MGHGSGVDIDHVVLVIISTSPMGAMPQWPLSATAGEASVEVTSLNGGLTAAQTPPTFLDPSVQARVVHVYACSKNIYSESRNTYSYRLSLMMGSR